MARIPPVALAWGAVEQGIAALTPFAVGLAAVRVLPETEHGRLALMAAGLAAGLAVFTAVVLDPLTARGRVRPATVGAALALWGVLALLGTAAMAMAGGGGLAGAAVLGLAGSAGTALLTLARRVGHLRRHPRRGAVVVLAAAAVTAALAWGATSAEGFLVALAFGSGLAGALGLIGAARRPGRRALRAALDHHRRMGGWLLVSAGPWIIATQAPLVVLAANHGEAAAGALRALLLLALPVAHVSAAVGTVVQPRLAAAARRGDVRRACLRWGVLIAALAAPWTLLLALAPMALAGAVLGPAYLPAAPVLPVVALSALLGALGAGPALALRAARRARPVAVASAGGALVALGTAVLLVPSHGLAGAALALVAGRAADIALQLAALGLPNAPPRPAEAWA